MVLGNGNTPKITAQAIAGAVHSHGSHQRRYMAAPLAPGAGPGRTALASRRGRGGAGAGAAPWVAGGGPGRRALPSRRARDGAGPGAETFASAPGTDTGFVVCVAA